MRHEAADHACQKLHQTAAGPNFNFGKCASHAQGREEGCPADELPLPSRIRLPSIHPSLQVGVAAPVLPLHPDTIRRGCVIASQRVHATPGHAMFCPEEAVQHNAATVAVAAEAALFSSISRLHPIPVQRGSRVYEQVSERELLFPLSFSLSI